MIGIFSKSEFEYTTEIVINWILHSNGEFTRINGDDISDLSKYAKFKLLGDDNTKHEYDGINVIWYRRWNNGKKIIGNQEECHTCNNAIELNSHLRKEQGKLNHFLFNQLGDKKWLSNPKTANLNKLSVLFKAKAVGLKIPKSTVCTEKAELIEFCRNHENVITKCLSDSPGFNKDKSFYTLQTSKVDIQFVKDLPEQFFPSFFQEEVKKEYEIRSFFLEDTFYSMAIFSQSNEKTKLDFRNYDTDKPNRNIPYQIPLEIENKLRQLMIDLDLNTGSIDLIKSESGEYYFLEINPVGQFGMVSDPCNYYLEKRVADYLIKQDENI